MTHTYNTHLRATKDGDAIAVRDKKQRLVASILLGDPELVDDTVMMTFAGRTRIYPGLDGALRWVALCTSTNTIINCTNF